MLIAIPDLLDAAQVATIRALIDPAEWVDGNITSGPQSAMAKRNLQLPEDCPAARQAGQMILDALGRSPLFIAAALPLKIFPPLFNSYVGGQAFGVHVDNAVRIQAGTGFRVRSDMSMSVFLESPETYDGGELTIETNFGVQRGCMTVVVKGRKGGAPREVRVHMFSGESGLGEGTGVPAALGVMLMQQGKVKEKGVLPPEGCVDPADFMALALQVMGDQAKARGGKRSASLMLETIKADGTVERVEM